MRIRTRTTIILPSEDIPADTVVNLPRKIAQDLIDRGAAEPVRQEIVIDVNQRGLNDGK